MSEGQDQSENGGKGQEDNAGGGQSGPITQEQLNKILATQKREIEGKFAGYDDLKSKAEQLDQLTAASKSELQQANDAAADIKSKYEASQGDNAKLQTQLLRQQIAAEKGLPPKMWKRVSGDTKDEITADVDDLLSSAPGSGGGKKSFESLRSGSSAPDGSTPKQRAAAALRGIRDK